SRETAPIQSGWLHPTFRAAWSTSAPLCAPRRPLRFSLLRTPKPETNYIPRPTPTLPTLSPLHPTVARIIAIANQKGGVGKTTTAAHLAASLAVADRRTLLVDGDPQGNASSGIGLDKNSLETTIYDVFAGEAAANDAIQKNVLFSHLDVLPATPDLAGAE